MSPALNGMDEGFHFILLFFSVQVNIQINIIHRPVVLYISSKKILDFDYQHTKTSPKCLLKCFYFILNLLRSDLTRWHNLGLLVTEAMYAKMSVITRTSNFLNKMLYFLVETEIQSKLS